MADLPALSSETSDIVLVGNGPSVLASHCGPLIDSFRNIVRFNGFKVDGFEAHVGARTTIWSRWYALPEMQPLGSLDRIWINMPIHERTEEKLHFAMAKFGPFQDRVEVIPSDRIATSLHQELFEGTSQISKWPSSGVLAIAHCLSQGMNVVLAGFDSWVKEPFHYYEEHDRTHSHHVAELERDYIERLVRAGRVRRI